jgi:hypothetical protein
MCTNSCDRKGEKSDFTFFEVTFEGCASLIRDATGIGYSMDVSTMATRPNQQ